MLFIMSTEQQIGLGNRAKPHQAKLFGNLIAEAEFSENLIEKNLSRKNLTGLKLSEIIRKKITN